MLTDLSLDQTIKLARIIVLFDQVNQDCQVTDETVIPFEPTDECVEFYQEQMDNLEYSQEDIELFSTWLLSL